jgi:hypothetical protein
MRSSGLGEPSLPVGEHAGEQASSLGERPIGAQGAHEVSQRLRR